MLAGVSALPFFFFDLCRNGRQLVFFRRTSKTNLYRLQTGLERQGEHISYGGKLREKVDIRYEILLILTTDS